MFGNSEQRVGMVLLPEAQKRAEEVFATQRIKESDFADLYGADVIEEDKRRLHEREMEIDDLFRADARGHEVESKNTLELASVFEAVMVSRSSWFGMPTNTRTYATTKFDNVFHGVDAIVEKVSPGQGSTELGLGIDMTFGKNIEVIKRKIEKIKRHIDQGELTRVKYFKSKQRAMRGELSELPLVVVGSTADTARELTNLFARREDAKLEEHQVQFQIMEEIIIQCEYFAGYARAQKKEDLAKRYDGVKAFIVSSMNLNKRLVDDGDKGVRDQFFADLRSLLV